MSHHALAVIEFKRFLELELGRPGSGTLEVLSASVRAKNASQGTTALLAQRRSMAHWVTIGVPSGLLGATLARKHTLGGLARRHLPRLENQVREVKHNAEGVHHATAVGQACYSQLTHIAKHQSLQSLGRIEQALDLKLIDSDLIDSLHSDDGSFFRLHRHVLTVRAFRLG